MNKILKHIIYCLLPLVSVSCLKDEMHPVGNESIMLSINSGVQTKAVVADTDIEAKVSHIDVVIFDASGAYVHNERLSDNGTNRYALAARRSDFEKNVGYHVYVVANSTADAAVFYGISLNDLKKMEQADENLVFTGLAGTGNPQVFLMDAVAYTSANEPETSGTVILNDGVLENTTELKATLRRAAAKISVTIMRGSEDLVFATGSDITSARYYVRNHPYTTTVTDGYDYDSELKSSPQSPVSAYFTWKPDSLAITTYAYAHDWKNESVVESETSLLVNIPMTYKGNLLTQNWYKIPMSRDSKFDRNTYYSIIVAVNAPGAEDVDNPVELDEIEYGVEEWIGIGVSVGGDSNRPKYLDLNTNSINMYNVNEDSDQITFASSSEIVSIELLEAYYYNKHNVKTNVAADIRSNISASAEEGELNGNITVFSPIVALSEEERQAMIDALGPRPDDPSGTEPVNPEVPYAAKPNPDDFLPSSDWYTYYYEGTEGNYEFYRKGNLTGNVQERNDIKRQYDAAWSAYQAYLNWANATDKDEQIEKYQHDLAAYEAANEVYVAWNDKYQQINATAKPSHYNTIRYMTFEVTNEQGLTEIFTVQQYPVIYITNSLGWYSYRKDFKYGNNAPTTYQKAGPDRIVSVSLSIRNGQWQNNYSTSGNNGYWFSKVRTGMNTTGNTQVSWYSWTENGRRQVESRSTDNVRLYHVHVTSTSPEYIVGRPKMTVDAKSGLTVTDPSESNSKLVSPSFMIASRLGYFITNGGNLSSADDDQRLEIFRVHCANYVEVHGDESNPIIYDGWRLPTEAELKIIMDTQGNEGEDAAAVDYLLNAGYYFGAAGPVWNSKNDDGIREGASTNSKSVRCVRDVY